MLPSFLDDVADANGDLFRVAVVCTLISQEGEQLSFFDLFDLLICDLFATQFNEFILYGRADVLGILGGIWWSV